MKNIQKECILSTSCNIYTAYAGDSTDGGRTGINGKQRGLTDFSCRQKQQYTIHQFITACHHSLPFVTVHYRSLPFVTVKCTANSSIGCSRQDYGARLRMDWQKDRRTNNKHCKQTAPLVAAGNSMKQDCGWIGKKTGEPITNTASKQHNRLQLAIVWSKIADGLAKRPENQ